MGHVSGLWRKAVSVLAGGVAMAAVGVTLAALPASGQSGGGLPERRLTLQPVGTAADGSLLAATVEEGRAGVWAPVAGESVTFALVGEGSMQVGDGTQGAQCVTGADGRCHATVAATGSEASLVLATSGDLSANVTLP